jgi:hypothetical protein
MGSMTNNAESTACRLCGGTAGLEFTGLVLDRYTTGYYRCHGCGSLQTGRPHWLDEAYASPDRSIDTGAAGRVLDSFVLVYCIARLFKCRRLFDFGGNTGLLCRLLRDRGFDALTYDRYIQPVYAPHFTGDPAGRYDLVSAFEVVEHFANPEQELRALFEPGPQNVLVTTELFVNQQADWWYLAQREGQHVFFYSAAAAQLIASRYGYRLTIGRGFLLFSRSTPSRLQRLTVQWLLRPRLLRLIGGLLLTRRGAGAQRDYAELTMRPTRKD